jgi:WD40 repeat protein
VDTGRLVDTFPGLKGTTEGVAAVPDGRFVALGGTDNRVHIWPAEGVGTLRSYPMTSAVTALAVPPDGNSVCIGLADGYIRRIYVTTNREAGRFERHTGAVTGLALSPDGTGLLSGGVDRTLRLWQVPTRKPLQVFKGVTGKVTAVAFAPNSLRVLAGDEKVVRLWDIRSPAPLRSFEGHTGTVLGVACSPNVRYLLSAGADGTVRVWDAETGQEVRRLVVQR